VGFQTVAFCEIDKYCRLVLKKHWKDIKIYPDVREITRQQYEQDGCELPEVITGGFPCQPFSVAGRQKGSGDNRYLWPEMFRVIKEFKPRWIIAENVRGIINIQDGVVFENVCTDLESQGYEIQTFIIPAAGIGAPHRRDRVWIVANSRRTIRGEQSAGNKESIGSGTSQETKWSADSDSVARSSEREKIMADSSSIQSDGRGRSNDSIKEQGQEQTGGTGGSLANAERIRQSRSREPIGSSDTETNQTRQTSRSNDGSQRTQGWWDFEPDVGRVAHGVSGRVHRLKGLGNSIIPQIAEEIGKAIMKVELDSD
jgi:DNA (cytosine-5)-methyltransferase 1